MTDKNAKPYVCPNCGTKSDNAYNFCARYEPFGTCPSCMTNEELYALEFGGQNA